MHDMTSLSPTAHRKIQPGLKCTDGLHTHKEKKTPVQTPKSRKTSWSVGYYFTTMLFLLLLLFLLSPHYPRKKKGSFFLINIGNPILPKIQRIPNIDPDYCCYLLLFLLLTIYIYIYPLLSCTPELWEGGWEFARRSAAHDFPAKMWGFPKIMGTFLGVPIMRTIVF